MPIKNYTTQVPAARSIQEIQEALVKHGAMGVLFEYEQGTGRVHAMKFILEANGRKMPFQLPVDWRAFQRVLKEQRVNRHSEEDYCYRVAWRVVRDWVMAQMALYETQMVTIPQIFLPYAVAKNGQTLYEYTLENPRLLGTAEDDNSDS